MLYPPFDFRSTSHLQLTPGDRCVDDGLISIAWNAGTLHVQYVGLREVAASAVDVISEAMWRFAVECQLMLVLYNGVLQSRDTIRQQLGNNTDRDAAFTVSSSYADGTLRAIWAQIPLGRVLDAFSAGGDFETLYAKSFVVFTYQMWEDFARPTIAQALGVAHTDVQSDLMGEWRHLRNWLVHPDEKTEESYFKNANILAGILVELRPGTPEVNPDMVFPLMGYLNSLHVIVNPDDLSPGLEITDSDSTLVEQASKDPSKPETTMMPVWRRFNPPKPDSGGAEEEA